MTVKEFMLAGYNGDLSKILSGLKEHDVNVKNDKGNTIIRYAVASGMLEVAQYLIGHGADPHIENDLGVSAYKEVMSGYRSDFITYFKQLNKAPEEKAKEEVKEVVSDTVKQEEEKVEVKPVEKKKSKSTKAKKTTSKGLKIVGLSIENMRKIRAINMEFTDKGLTQIVGKNKQGKTTALDSIELALGKFDSSKVSMITNGEKKSKVMLDLGDYNVTRDVNNKNTKSSSLKIETKEGKKVPKPVEFVDSLINELTFNPYIFINKKLSAKMEALKSLQNIGSEIDKIDYAIKEQSEERTLVGRERKKLGEHQTIEEEYLYMDIKELLQKKQDIDRANYENKEYADMRQDTQERITLLKKQLEAQEEKLEAIPLPNFDIESSDSVVAKINKLEEVNKLYYEQQGIISNNKEIEVKDKEYKAITKKIDKLKKDKNEVYKNADFGVEGLEIREDEIYFNGNSSNDWSDSEAMEVSLKLCASMNPKLRAIFYDKGESFDQESLNALHKWGIENDMQIIITRVSDTIETSSDSCFYIEEGEIK